MIVLRLKKKEREALNQAEESFLSVFDMIKKDEDASDTLEGAMMDFKEYLIARGLLEEPEDE